MKIIECPRDAMQGISKFIPTDIKAAYINQLLKIGFDTIDFGSFVSPKAIPQMKDTAEVLKLLDLQNSSSKLLAIVANKRGAEDASSFEEITYLGFPFSISETFQKRNTNRSIEEALATLDEIQDLCERNRKELVAYISMSFGNPYNDPYDVDVVLEYSDKLASRKIKIISLADTIGVSEPGQIQFLFNSLINSYPDVEFGAHLHSNPSIAEEKIEAAYRSGCRRFDGALKGFGGCPMAKDDLVGNIATEEIIKVLEKEGQDLNINMKEFRKGEAMTVKVFS